ncbi:MAG: pyridoxal-phosphate dependent enzyme [Moraxellaceae bacterium]|nr:pyridoxal-phosphate dependent enzyme [Moraxellaceae bacterium]
MLKENPIPYQNISLQGQQITVKRLDKVNPYVSGNKFYKLKYNLAYAQANNYQQIVSFGGAYSNHIYALAHACAELGLQAVGIIRGEELANKPLNASLQSVQNLGMKLHFISRQQYRQKHTAEFLAQLQQQYPNSYIIPEGGTNSLAIKGTEEILSETDKNDYDYICCAVGTGGTIAGIINASCEKQQIIGFSALNSTYQAEDIEQWTNKNNWQIFADDVFNGYGRYNDKLIDFIADIKETQGVELEPIYTGKALYRLSQLLSEEKKGRGLFIHTGGLHTFD